MLDPELRRALADRVRYYNQMGIYDFYRRDLAITVDEDSAAGVPSLLTFDSKEDMSPRRAAVPVATDESIFEIIAPKPEQSESDPANALKIIREDLGDCTRCVLHQQGRKQIVFGVGNPRAELMFIGEAPGADEDQQGEPFVGRAGQLLTNMIKAMGLGREQVYIANIIKCRPPGNRTPEREECDTCSPFLLRQIDAIQPRVIVALGAVAAKNLLGLNDSMASMRGRLYDFRGAKLVVTYHPAYLLRDPRQKGEVWKDLQIAMRELGLKVPARKPE